MATEMGATNRTPSAKQSLSPEQRAASRQRIAFDVEVILQGYWDKQPPPEVKAGILADWADTLEDWTQEQVLFALRKWRNEQPSRPPNPGHILCLLRELRAKAEWKRAPKVEEPKQITSEPIPLDRRIAIAAELGLPDMSAYVKQFGSGA